jgi:hypothetical protein
MNAETIGSHAEIVVINPQAIGIDFCITGVNPRAVGMNAGITVMNAKRGGIKADRLVLFRNTIVNCDRKWIILCSLKIPLSTHHGGVALKVSIARNIFGNELLFARIGRAKKLCDGSIFPIGGVAPAEGALRSATGTSSTRVNQARRCSSGIFTNKLR